jgi:SAM-dependent methyltransferase
MMNNQPKRFPPDMDNRFLQFIGSSVESQERIHRFYLPFFADCHTVVDLGCGMGGFAGLLARQGIHAIGVDLDLAAVDSARCLGAEGIQADALDYLAELGENSVDGIFAGHLVEHMPCEVVFELTQRAHRSLRSGGRLVIATPNVRGLFAHLEMFYMHFDHERFYHPQLLCFFMQQTGFKDWEWGENPELNHLLFSDIWPRLESALDEITDSAERLAFDDLFQALQKVGSTPSAPGFTGGMLGEELGSSLSEPEQPLVWWRRLICPIRVALINWLVRPELHILKAYQDWLRVYADWLKISVDSTRALAFNTHDLLRMSLERIDCSFECYATAIK